MAFEQQILETITKRLQEEGIELESVAFLKWVETETKPYHKELQFVIGVPNAGR